VDSAQGSRLRGPARVESSSRPWGPEAPERAGSGCSLGSEEQSGFRRFERAGMRTQSLASTRGAAAARTSPYQITRNPFVPFAVAGGQNVVDALR